MPQSDWPVIFKSIRSWKSERTKNCCGLKGGEETTKCHPGSPPGLSLQGHHWVNRHHRSSSEDSMAEMSGCSFPDSCTVVMEENVLVCRKHIIKYLRVMKHTGNLLSYSSRKKKYCALHLQFFCRLKSVSKFKTYVCEKRYMLVNLYYLYNFFNGEPMCFTHSKLFLKRTNDISFCSSVNIQRHY